MTVHIIGFTGKARSGKDTCANIITELVSQYNDEIAQEITDMYPIARESFAGPLKTMVAVLLDFYGIGSMMDKTSTWEYIEGELKEEVIEVIGASPRRLMQTLGTDWGRNIIKDSLWVDSMKTRLKGYEEAGNLGYAGAVVLVTDVRFDNEAQAIRDAGGRVVRLIRDTGDAVLAHASEAGVSPDLVDYTIHNSYDTTHNLEVDVELMVTELLPFMQDFRPKLSEVHQSNFDEPIALEGAM